MRTLIKDALIVTQNKRREVIPRGFVVLRDDTIERVGRGIPPRKLLHSCQKIIDARKLLVSPGFINPHVHLGESIYAFLLPEVFNLRQYLDITNRLARQTDSIEKNRAVIGDYSIFLHLKSGTSTICGGRTALIAKRWGMRNVSGYMLMNSAKLRKYSQNTARRFETELRGNRGSQLTYPAIFIHSLNTITPAELRDSARLLDIHPEAKLIVHAAETKEGESAVERDWEGSTVSILDRHGLLSNRTMLVHGNWFSEKDLRLIRKRGASIIHCLSSNCNVADQTLNLEAALAKKITVALGTDGLATARTLDILQEARFCFLYHNRFGGSKISTAKIFDLITIDAARALGLEHKIGSIEQGKKADVVFVDSLHPLINKSDPIRSIVYGAQEEAVRGVMIDGKIKLWNGTLVAPPVSERTLLSRFTKLIQTIKEEAA
ncbi:MAG: amidohydrolase family protein [bacterium]|nr:amidohydrolase family protein [bacterium]